MKNVLKLLNRRFLAILVLLVLLHITDEIVEAQVIIDSLESKSLQNKLLNESSTRKIHIYLPLGYDQRSHKKYPTLYLLHSFGSKPTHGLGKMGMRG